MVGRIEPGALVVYVGPDEPDIPLYRGQPGKVVDSVDGAETSVSLVMGPSVSVPTSEVSEVGQEEYDLRARRLRAGLHPVDNRAVAVEDIGDP